MPNDVDAFLIRYNKFINSKEVVPEVDYLRVLQTAATKYSEYKLYGNGPENKSSYTKRIRSIAVNIEKIRKNLGYDSSLKDWEKFYCFPSSEFIDYCKKNYRINNDTLIANSSFESAIELRSHLINLCNDAASNNSVQIQFMQGETGVGKTTFLKYFSKSSYDDFLTKKIVTSRVKYRDIERIIDAASAFDAENPKSVEIFEEHIVSCLYRDIISSIIRDPSIVSYDNSSPAITLRNAVEDTILELASKNDFSIEETYNKFKDDIVYDVYDIDLIDKLKCINYAKSLNINFLIYMDGFDAIHPEEIDLLDASRERVFFNLIRRAITNNYTRGGGSPGACLSSINKTFLIAARPITVAEIEKRIEPDVDFKTKISRLKVYIIGCEMKSITEARFLHYYPDYCQKAADFEVFWDIIEYALSQFRVNYRSIEKNKFIDLFNHNIREKISFLIELLHYTLSKIEFYFQMQYKQSKERIFLDRERIKKYLVKKSVNLPKYELDRLLLLNDDGLFENHFTKTDGRFVLNAKRGPIENIFNYSNKTDDWVYRTDPLLIRYYIVTKVIHTEMSIDTLSVWVKQIFGEPFDDLSREVAFLIRSGLVSVSYTNSEIRINSTRRGQFLVEEFMYSSVYIEHVLLRTLVPMFVAQNIEPPVLDEDHTHRMWGGVAAYNIAVMLRYILAVEKAQIDHSLGLMEGIPRPSVGILSKSLEEVKRSIVEGINSSDTKYREYMKNRGSKLFQVDNSSVFCIND